MFKINNKIILGDFSSDPTNIGEITNNGGVLKVKTPEGVINLSPTTGSNENVQVFTSNGTWTKPATGTFAMIFMLGGGGGGGSGRRGASLTNRFGGNGGSFSGFVHNLIVPLSFFSSTESVVVGAGGAGGASITSDNTNGNLGSTGGNSSFGIFRAFGGAGGAGGGSTANSGQVEMMNSWYAINQGISITGGTTTVPNAMDSNNFMPTRGGAGGSLDSSDLFIEAGNGGSSNKFVQTYGAGSSTQGGQSGSNGSSGQNGANASRYSGGAGGGGGSASNSTAAGKGGNGGNYGSGGGGGGASLSGYNSGAGGNGGAGIVIVITF